jgi:dTDP-4-amino-4,6-dideoxygalactose transaminase
MRKAEIGVNVHYTPVHLHPYYRRLGFAPGMFPECERFSEEALTLPLFPALSSGDLDRVVRTLDAALAQRKITASAR